MPPVVSPAVFEKIRQLDTCTVSNAIERLNGRLRNEGFAAGSIRCQFPKFKPMLGYAVTGKIRTSSAPITGGFYHDRIGFLHYLDSVPEPRVMVVEDVDQTPGLGALVGEIHATIAQALHCTGYVTNGAVRDLAAVEAMGFHLFAGSVAVSHAYAHIVEFGESVQIGGLKVASGDLIHGDRHGLQKIPLPVAAEIPNAAARLEEEERQLIAFCHSSEFSLEGLERLLQLSWTKSS